MALVNTNTNPALKSDNKVIFEDLENKVFNTSPEETPISSLIGSRSIDSREYEWAKRGLRAGNKDNSSPVASKTTIIKRTGAERIKNQPQIFEDGISLDDYTARAAGGTHSFKEEIARTAIELKLDLEASIASKNASVKPLADGTTAGKSAGFGAFIATNSSHGASGGAAGGYKPATGLVNAPTAGTARKLTEAIFNDVLYKRAKNAKKATGGYDCFTSWENKKIISTFKGREIDRANGDGMIVNSTVDVFKTDAGIVRVHPHHEMDDTQIHIIDKEYAHIGIIQPYRVKELSTDGKATNHSAMFEATLVVTDEKAHATIQDLNPAA